MSLGTNRSVLENFTDRGYSKPNRTNGNNFEDPNQKTRAYDGPVFLGRGELRCPAVPPALLTAPRPRGRPGPSPRPVLTVVGLKAFHTMVSQMFVAMKREIPEPRPYPFCSSSSKSKTIKPATKSCGNLKRKKKIFFQKPQRTAHFSPARSRSSPARSRSSPSAGTRLPGRNANGGADPGQWGLPLVTSEGPTRGFRPPLLLVEARPRSVPCQV